MEKLRNILLIIVGIGFITSCSEWLDIKPKSEVKSELMFQSESGFKDALTGVYILIRGNSLYGREMTWGFLDAIGQNYDVRSGSSYYNASRYVYSRTTNISDGIWKTAYNAIANLNNLLENIEIQKDIFSPATYGIIKGEALGLRAFLHFDLLRLFGWGDLENKPDNRKRLCIPYMTQYSKDFAKQLTVEEVLGYVERDLEEAMDLLNTYDPYGLIPKEDDYYLPNDDKYFDNRKRHFSYWAAVGILARAYMWDGKKAEALKLALLAIEKGAETSWVNGYNLDSYYERYRDIAFSSEFIFSLEIPKLFDQIKPYLDPVVNDPNPNNNLINQKESRAKKVFEFSNGGSTDYRYRKHFNTINKYFDGWAINKFWEVQDYNFGKAMPLLKRAEMYYIAAECLLATNSEADKKKAIDLINTVRRYRGISSSYNLPYSLSALQVRDEITKEYQKEFLCEGQLFFYYKRLGFTTIPYATKPGNDAAYVVPLPIADVGLGGLEDYKK